MDKLLLISSSEVGQRATQHQNVINAAKTAGVKFIAYTSLLHADNSPLGLHVEHVATEKALAASGIPYALLRNGWYTENYLASAPPALEHGVFIGAAGEGKIASATRADYAAADARTVTSGLLGRASLLPGRQGRPFYLGNINVPVNSCHGPPWFTRAASVAPAG